VPEGKVSIGPPGLDTELFRPAKYNPNGYILSVGRFSDPRKNIGTLFKAYSVLRSRRPSTPSLVLSGFVGPKPEDWDLADRLGIRSYVHFKEKPTTAELVKLYQDAALFVLSSDEEGFGIVLLEAMATGTPVVCTRCGGPEDIISHGETGYLTPVNDPGALAIRMEELLADPLLRERIGAAGREIVERRFSLTAAGKAYLDKYDELLDHRVTG
jgi:glycosyltransferase involved in cell wall biosynthesis